MKTCTRVMLLAVGLVWLPASVSAQNTSTSTAVNLLVGQTPVRITLPTGTSTRYYSAQVVDGRSYCAEATSSETELNPTDAELRILASNGTTERASNADTLEEPFGLTAARACFIASADETVFLEIKPHDATTENREYTMRVVETTLWANWFFVGGSYSSYTLVRNTLSTPLSNVVITWRNQAGGVAATKTISLPANGIDFIDARQGDVLGCVLPTVCGTILGSVEIAHRGSPEAIVGSQTTISPSTGLSFDTILFQRRAW